MGHLKASALNKTCFACTHNRVPACDVVPRKYGGMLNFIQQKHGVTFQLIPYPTKPDAKVQCQVAFEWTLVWGRLLVQILCSQSIDAIMQPLYTGHRTIEIATIHQALTSPVATSILQITTTDIAIKIMNNKAFYCSTE